jgi:thiamine-monophosphate kinase
VGQAVQKVVTSNVSDIYAMGGEPAGIVFTAGLPAECGEEAVVSIVDGLERAIGTYGMRLFGGDTVSSPAGYFFDVAIIGAVEEGCGVFKRSGASPGDLLVLFGQCGGSLAGLKILESLSGMKPAGGLERLIPPGQARAAMLGTTITLSLETTRADIEAACAARMLPEGTAEALELIARHICPRSLRPSVNGSPEYAGAVTAMIDISDGLARDLSTLCSESGVGAVISEESLPAPPAVAGALEGDRRGLTELIISSGEEYVALASVRAGSVPPGAVVIGEIEGEATGVVIESSGGDIREMPATGYEHGFGE